MFELEHRNRLIYSFFLSNQEALSICSEDDYESRREAIEDNFERVKKYFCVEDYLCDNYPDILNH